MSNQPQFSPRVVVEDTTNGRPRRSGTGLGLLLLFGAVVLFQVGRVSLVRTELASGPALFVCLLFLAGYGLRRLAPRLVPFTSGTWYHLHAVVGMLTVALFLVHTGLRLPNGFLERTLACVYVVILVSGVVGVGLSRRLTRRLAAIQSDDAETAWHELLTRLQEQAELVVERSTQVTGSLALGDIYAADMADYFRAPRHRFGHLLGSHGPRNRLLSRIMSQTRELSAAERQLAGELITLIRAKDELDARIAVQWALQIWLFAHVPLTFVLLLLAAAHGVIARAFLLGGVP